MAATVSPRPTPPSGPAPALADLVAGLRGAWRAAAQSVTDTPELAELLEQRLDELEAWGMLDQAALGEVLDEAAGHLQRAGLEAEATALTRRLLRSVYEFLLAVDARRQTGPTGDDGGTALPPPAIEEVPAAAGETDRIELLVRRGALEEASGALRRLGDSGAGARLADVAMEAGDGCRAAGMARAAGDCYLAAWGADRLDERALWRLADLAVAAGDHDLAVSYLDRVAAVLRWRGDTRGIARVYRKMSILAPDREDVRELLRRARDEAATH